MLNQVLKVSSGTCQQSVDVLSLGHAVRVYKCDVASLGLSLGLSGLPLYLNL